MQSTKTITRKEQTTLINNYMLSAVDCEGFTAKSVGPEGTIIDMPVVCTTDKDKVNFVMGEFERYDYANNVERIPNTQLRFADWLMGLPSCFNIDYANYRILEIVISWQSLHADASERAKDKIISNWFNFIAAKFIMLHTKLNNTKEA